MSRPLPAGRPRPTRRRMVTLSAATLGIGAAALTLDRCSPGTLSPPRPEGGAATDRSPITNRALARFGFLVGQPATGDDRRVAEDLALVASLGMGWVRFGLGAYTAVRDWDATEDSIDFDDDVFDDVRSSMQRARNLGLKVCFMLIDVYPDASASERHFAAKMTQYWTRMASELGQHADLVQIFNEADGLHYRTYEGFDGDVPDSYLGELAGRLALARDVFHAHAPGSRVTTNLYGYPVDEPTEVRWHRVLDVLAPSLDVITVDAYPQLWTEDIADLPHKLSRLKDRYGKPVVVGELGINTCSTCFTAAEQARAYGMYVQALRDSVAEAVIFYELRDGRPGDKDPSTFGVVSGDGTDAKPAWNALVRADGRSPDDASAPATVVRAVTAG